MLKLIIIVCAVLREVILSRGGGGGVWEKDLSSAMKIGLSRTGYKGVDLRCDPGHFAVNVTLEDDFGGVVYTRGSFDEKKPPCFRRFQEGDSLVISLRIPFDSCRTVMDVAESRYSNTLVVQHDPDLIMPGDAAFALDCSFVPEFKVEGGVNVGELPFKSRITLVDADPSAEETNPDEGNIVTAFSKTEKVSFVPGAEEARDEL